MPYHIRIQPIGRTANQTLQYMVALALREGLGNAEISGVWLPEWGIESPPVPTRRRLFSVAFGHAFPMPLVMWLASELRDLDINGIGWRLTYFRAHLELFRKVLRPQHSYRESFDADHLAIHVRCGDVVSGIHSNMFPLAISWYRELLETRGLRPVFVGEFGDATCAPALLAAFPDAVFISQDDPMVDFHILRTSVHVVTAISTFSWPAAWLSERAETATLPVGGFFHPGAKPDIDLLPCGDPRYRFHLSNRQRWTGSANELAELACAEHDFSEVSHARIERSFPTIGTFGHVRAKPDPAPSA